jgi:hypothetical protein
VGVKVREIGSILKAKLGWILPSNRKNISENLGNFIFIVFGKDWEFLIKSSLSVGAGFADNLTADGQIID